MVSEGCILPLQARRWQWWLHTRWEGHSDSSMLHSLLPCMQPSSPCLMDGLQLCCFYLQKKWMTERRGSFCSYRNKTQQGIVLLKLQSSGFFLASSKGGLGRVYVSKCWTLLDILTPCELNLMSHCEISPLPRSSSCVADISH